MNIFFYLAAAVALFSTIMVVTLSNAIHALIYFLLSLFSIAVIFFTMGAPFVGTLEIIVYSGAIMVLFVFVVMLLNIGPGSSDLKNPSLTFKHYVVPGTLFALLVGQLCYFFICSSSGSSRGDVGIKAITPKEIGIALFTDYQLSVEMASMILFAGLIGAYHIGRRFEKDKENNNFK